MWYLFLDESGDLGFDFVNKKPSSYFTVCILATSDPNAYFAIRRGIKCTLRRKINKSKPKYLYKNEVKATETPLPIKKYFYDMVRKTKFGIYAITLNKRRVYEKLTREKERVYNFISRKVLDEIPFEKATCRVQLTIDKSKGRKEILEFNHYIIQALKSRLDPTVPLQIDHLHSCEDAGLQAVDLFAWGFLRKYEKTDSEWFDYYAEKVRLDDIYLPGK